MGSNTVDTCESHHHDDCDRVIRTKHFPVTKLEGETTLLEEACGYVSPPCL